MSNKPILLVADDEEYPMHDLANRALGREYRVIYCGTGSEVVKTVVALEGQRKRERIEIALLDFVLPWGGEGEAWFTSDLIRFLREKGVRVGVITGWKGEDIEGLGVPVFNKLGLGPNYNEGLRAVVRKVRGEKGSGVETIG